MLRNRVTPKLVIAAALAASLSALGASPAMATPKGEFAVFAQCPTSLTINGCLVARTESGEFTIGKQEVPIVNTQTLQGGLINIAPPDIKEIVAAVNGETLTKTPQKVPGGLTDLVRCNEIKGEGFFEKLERGACEFIFENKYTGVNATVELAGPASSIGLNEGFLAAEVGTALALPVKVKLENELLGKECYIGSNSNPIKLNLTTGTSGSKKGKLGEIGERAEGNILVIKNNTLVDNTFTAPGVTGCGEGLSWLLDPIINGKLGLPSASGTNVAVLNGTLEQAGIGAVRESE